MSEKTEYVISLKDLFSNGITTADKNAEKFEKRVMSLQGMLARIGGVIAVGTLAKGIFDAGTNMEGLNISLQTMLGNKAEADKLVAEMVSFAATTPFSQSEVQTAGKQLLAYGIVAKDIVPTLRQLGDVSAGLNQPIGEIAYLYGTIKTQGKAMTVDIRQFANRGIPIYEELAKVTGKTGAELQKYIEAGKIGFPEIQKAFENMSGAGGKFAGLTEKLSKTTGGQWSNMKDQLEQIAVTIFNELQPAINWFIKALQTTLGYVKELIKWMKEHATLIKTVAIVITTAVVAYKTITIATEVWEAAQGALNVVMAANPIGIFIIAVTALAGAIYLAKKQYDGFLESIESAKQKGRDISERRLYDKVNALVKEKGLTLEVAKAEALASEKRVAMKAYEIARVNEMILAAKSGGIFNTEELRKAQEQRQGAQAALLALGKKSVFDNFSKSTTTGAVGTDVKSVKNATGLDSATAPKHTVITINIDKLIEKFTIMTNTVAEGAQSMKEQIVKALIEVVNDSQILAGE